MKKTKYKVLELDEYNKLSEECMGHIDYSDNTHAIKFCKRKTFPIILKILERRNLNEEV